VTHEDKLSNEIFITKKFCKHIAPRNIIRRSFVSDYYCFSIFCQLAEEHRLLTCINLALQETNLWAIAEVLNFFSGAPP